MLPWLVPACMHQSLVERGRSCMQIGNVRIFPTLAVSIGGHIVCVPLRLVKEAPLQRLPLLLQDRGGAVSQAGERKHRLQLGSSHHAGIAV